MNARTRSQESAVLVNVFFWCLPPPFTWRVILPNKKSYRHFEKHSELPSPDVYLDLLKQLLKKHITC